MNFFLWVFMINHGDDCDVPVATLTLTGTLLLLLRTAYTLIKYSMPGSSPVTVAAVLSPDTGNSWRRPPGLVGTYVTRYSVTNISLFQDRSTVSLVTSPKVRSFGGDTGGKKMDQCSSQSFRHIEHAELQSHIWLEGEELPKKSEQSADNDDTQQIPVLY